MPIIVPERLPAYKVLSEENVFVINDFRAIHQDIRPLQIAIVNLMPTKEITETQLIRMLANTPLQVEVQLLHMESHNTKNTKWEHLNNFYKTFDEIRNQKFDGMIITGAPVESLPYEEVDYWKELSELMEYSKENVCSTLHICWGAQAGLYYHYGINKYFLDKKLFGVFPHRLSNPKSELLRGFDEEFYVPHSRYTQIKKEDILAVSELEILSESDEAGVNMIATKDKKLIFVQGHSEYDRDTLKLEYDRDVNKGIDIEVPKNYFVNDDPNNDVVIRWRSHASLFFSNWLNFVYQNTPYDINEIGKNR